MQGYEAEVNSSHPSEEHTGSLLGLVPVRVHLVAPDTWFDYAVRCCSTAGHARGVTFRDRKGGHV